MLTHDKLRYSILCTIMLCIAVTSLRLLCEKSPDQQPVADAITLTPEIALEAQPDSQPTPPETESHSSQPAESPIQKTPIQPEAPSQESSVPAQAKPGTPLPPEQTTATQTESAPGPTVEQAPLPTEQPGEKQVGSPQKGDAPLPQAPDQKYQFISLGNQFKHVSIAQGGTAPLLVGINQQGAVLYDGTAWKPLDKKDLKQIEIGGDGAIWGIDRKNQAWRKDNKGWTLATGSQLDYLAVGNKNDIWGLLKTTVYRKADPTGATPAWRPFAGQALHIAAGGDGSVWVIGGQDATLYKLYRPAARWQVIIKPGDAALGAPQLIRVADQFNIAFLDFQGHIWRLIPGKTGTSGKDWFMVSDQNFTTFSIGCDGTIVGISSRGELLKIEPLDKDKKALEQARGEEIRVNDVVNIISAWDGRQVWTQGSSPYDPAGTNAPPNNHLELLVGPITDSRQFSGGFFMLTHGQDENTQQREFINFNDEVEIFSLFAAPGMPKKSGLLGKEWKWWVHSPHIQLGKSWCDLAVSLLKYPGTQTGAQKIKIVSPYGLSGPVRRNDIVELVSSAPGAQNRKIFVRTHSKPGTTSYELAAPGTTTVDQEGITQEIFGPGETSGAQRFTIRSIIANEVPQVARAAYQQIIGKPIEPTGQQEGKKRTMLKAKLGDGIGIISKITNLTAYPLQTPTGTIKQGTGKFLGKTGVEGLIDQQVARVIAPGLLGATLEKGFWLSGIALETVTNKFESGTFVKLKKLWSKGVAWINESLQTPGSATVMFFARATDEGNIQVCFGDTISTQDIFRVVIGGWKNSKTAIVVDNNIIAEVKADVNPFAKAQPGQLLPYWVSMHNNFVMVGAGTPGTNIILASSLVLTKQPSRIGFSSHNQPVDYTEIIVGNPFLIKSGGNNYLQKPESIIIPADQGNITWSQTPLRVFNTGTVTFQTTAPHSVAMVLDNNQQEQYKIEFGANNNKSGHISKNGQTVLSVNLDTLPFAKLSSNKPTNFWVSIDDGRITVGQGTIGTNTFMLWEDFAPIRDVSRIGFVGTTFQQEITSLAQAPGVSLQEFKPKFEYTRTVRPVKQFKGPMVLIRPFEYQLIQDGPRVVFKDMNDDESLLVPVLATPMQNGRYPFSIMISANGKPEIKGSAPTDAPAKLVFEVAAAALSLVGDQTMAYAQLSGFAAKATNAIGAIPVVGQASMVIKNIALVAASTAMVSAGIAAKTAAASLKASIKYGARSHTSYVKTEEVEAEVTGKGDIPRQAIRNEAAVGQMLIDAQELKPSKKQDFEQLIALYQQIIRRINHPHVISKITTRTSLSSGMSLLMNGYKSYGAELQMQFLNLLISAITNSYLKTMPDAQQWSTTMTELLKERLLKAGDQPIELPALYGEYIWLPFEFSKQDQGGISFEVKASNDVFICFAQDQFKARSINNQVYEILLGGWNNNRHEIHIQNLGRPAAALNKEKNTQAMLSPVKFNKYWITLNNGDIKIGQNDPGKNTFLEWKDSFPWTGMRVIGISSWDTPIILKNAKLLTDQGVIAQETKTQHLEKAKAQAIKEGTTYSEDITDWQKDMKYRPPSKTSMDQYYRPAQGSLPGILPPSLSQPVTILPPLDSSKSTKK